MLFRLIVIVHLLVFAGALTFSAKAQTSSEQAALCETVPGSVQQICRIENPIAATSVPNLVNTVITGGLSVVGAFALLMFIWGAGAWLKSAGNPEKVKAGAQTMLWAAIGVILVFASYLVLSAILNTLSGKQ